MGFFSKMQSISQWTDEDLADESYKLSKLKVSSLSNMPWSKPEKLAARMAEVEKLSTREKAVETELARRGLTFAQVENRKLMRLLGK